VLATPISQALDVEAARRGQERQRLRDGVDASNAVDGGDHVQKLPVRCGPVGTLQPAPRQPLVCSGELAGQLSSLLAFDGVSGRAPELGGRALRAVAL
jgi:hypothetical protein